MMAINPVVKKLIPAAYFGAKYDSPALQDGLLSVGYLVSVNE